MALRLYSCIKQNRVTYLVFRSLISSLLLLRACSDGEHEDQLRSVKAGEALTL